MRRTIEPTAVPSGLVLLKARIIDGDGVPIQRSDVAAIEYSIYRVDRKLRYRWIRLSDAELPVDVDVVVFDSLQKGGTWPVDDVGYNFRHEIDLGEVETGVRAAAGVVVEYLMTPVWGSPMKIEFELGAI